MLVPLYLSLMDDPQGTYYSPFNYDPNRLAADLRSQAGQTVRLRFAQVNNQGAFQFGLDDIFLSIAAIPEPSTLTLVLMPVAIGLAFAVRKRMKRSA